LAREPELIVDLPSACHPIKTVVVTPLIKAMAPDELAGVTWPEG